MKIILTKKFFLILIIIVLSIFNGSCTSNVLEDASTKNSEGALIEEALKQLDNKEYTEALNILTTQISVGRQADADILRLTAEAYAGRCGLDAIQYIGQISDATSSAMFSLFYQPTIGTAALPTDCATATSKRVQIGAAAARSQSDNIFLAILSMFRLGVNIQTAVDTTPINGDGVLDSSVCDMTDDQIDQVILSFGLLLENLTYVSGNLVGDDALSSISQLQTLCTSLSIDCFVTESASITPAMRDIFRDLLNTTEYGVGSVVTSGNPVSIGLACP